MTWYRIRIWLHVHLHDHRVMSGKVVNPPSIFDFGYLAECQDCPWIAVV